eukprot:1476012-Prymnesium_polylepis.1
MCIRDRCAPAAACALPPLLPHHTKASETAAGGESRAAGRGAVTDAVPGQDRPQNGLFLVAEAVLGHHGGSCCFLAHATPAADAWRRSREQGGGEPGSLSSCAAWQSRHRSWYAALRMRNVHGRASRVCLLLFTTTVFEKWVSSVLSLGLGRMCACASI